MPAARTVYIIQSESNPEQYYIGLTSNLAMRLEQHNAGESKHTKKFRPWRVRTTIEFDNYSCAARFEKHLKAGSGRAFLKQHFL